MEEEATFGLRQGSAPRDLFKGAAPYYATYRRPYPPPVVDYLVSNFKLDGTGRLLDGGCGTGQVFSVLAPYFAQVLAFDQDAAMVELARRTAARQGLENVVISEMRAEDLDSGLGSFRMAVFGASFHWMDRVRVGGLVHDLLDPGGHLVALAPGSAEPSDDPVTQVVRATIVEFLGEQRRAGGGIFVPRERHAEALARTPFGPAVTVDIYVEEEWTAEQIIGWLFSTSFANRSLLGEEADAFERRLRLRLLELRPGGVFSRLVEYSVISAPRR